ncbi:hypothetical protein GCM10009557_18890 [Virgisporangium ochraceum]
MRRNVNVKILLFNNKIYGLTKGQYSPTSEIGKITKSTPVGSADSPFNPISLALGAEATFVARTLDTDRKHLQSVLRSAATHEGSAFVEIYQNCNIFNDNAFDTLKEPATRDDYTIRLEHGQPLTFGAENQWSVINPPGGFGLRVVPTDSVDPGEMPGEDLRNTPIGVFRKVARNSYDTIVREQLDTAKSKLAGDPEQELAALLGAGDTWTIL